MAVARPASYEEFSQMFEPSKSVDRKLEFAPTVILNSYRLVIEYSSIYEYNVYPD
jgi:hypothetical protein